jgi:hypothetical protein
MKVMFYMLFTALFLGNSILAQNELPAIATENKNDFYIPKATLLALKMLPGKGDAWMKLHNAETNALNGATRINDIRWQAKNTNDASVWMLKNINMLNENGENLTKQIAKPNGVVAFNVYGLSKELKDMNASLGLDMALYNFVFTVNKYIGKIVVSGNQKMTILDAYKIAKTGIDATIKAASKK